MSIVQTEQLAKIYGKGKTADRKEFENEKKVDNIAFVFYHKVILP